MKNKIFVVAGATASIDNSGMVYQSHRVVIASSKEEAEDKAFAADKAVNQHHRWYEAIEITDIVRNAVTHGFSCGVEGPATTEAEDSAVYTFLNSLKEEGSHV